MQAYVKNLIRNAQKNIGHIVDPSLLANKFQYSDMVCTLNAKHAGSNSDEKWDGEVFCDREKRVRLHGRG